LEGRKKERSKNNRTRVMDIQINLVDEERRYKQNHRDSGNHSIHEKTGQDKERVEGGGKK